MPKHDGPVIACIEFQSEGELKDALSLAAYHFDERNEEMRHCLLRERGMEVLACRKSGVPYIAVSEGDELLDGNVDLGKIDKEATRLAIRRFSSKPMHGYQGIEPLQDAADYERVKRWPEVVGDNNFFVKRNLRLVPVEEIAEQIRSRTLPLPCFLKQQDKGPSNNFTLRHILRTEEDLANFDRDDVDRHKPKDFKPGTLTYFFEAHDWWCPYRESWEKTQEYLAVLEEDLILSDVMEINRDIQPSNEPGATREYRSFVINGQVVNWSRYVDYDYLDVPESVISFTRRFAQEYEGKLPGLYVLDVAETTDGLQVVELNNYENSGRYLSNNPAAFYETLHQQYNRGVSFPYKQPMPVPAKREALNLDLGMFLKADLGI